MKLLKLHSFRFFLCPSEHIPHCNSGHQIQATGWSWSGLMEKKSHNLLLIPADFYWQSYKLQVACSYHRQGFLQKRQTKDQMNLAWQSAGECSQAVNDSC